jgi:hypothetical protein
MINYNIILYVGLFLIISVFILFVKFEMKKSRLDIEQARQASLDIAFKIAKQTEEKNKLNN